MLTLSENINVKCRYKQYKCVLYVQRYMFGLSCGGEGEAADLVLAMVTGAC